MSGWIQATMQKILFLSSQMNSYAYSPSYLPLHKGKWARLKYQGTDKTKGSRNFFTGIPFDHEIFEKNTIMSIFHCDNFLSLFQINRLFYFRYTIWSWSSRQVWTCYWGTKWSWKGDQSKSCSCHCWHWGFGYEW